MKGNPHNPVKLSQLRILVAVADEENFSEAALRLNMSQSAVSHAIAALEESLGVVLCIRGRQGAHLTPVGQRIVRHAREILDRMDDIEREAKLAKGLKGGQIRIATFRSVAAHLLPKVITEFHQRHPEISVSLDEHDDHFAVEQALFESKADIGLTVLPISKGLEAWEILHDEFIALFPPSFQPAQDVLTWEELAAYPLIMPPVDYIMMRRVYDHINGLGYRLNVVYEVETDATTVSLVAQGMGATILPRLAAEPIPAAVQVYSLPIPLNRVIAAAVLANTLHEPVVFAFLDILKADWAESAIAQTSN